MKAIEQYFHVVLFIMLYKVRQGLVTFNGNLWDETLVGNQPFVWKLWNSSLWKRIYFFQCSTCALARMNGFMNNVKINNRINEIHLINRLSAWSTDMSPLLTPLIKLIRSSSLMVVISHAINSDDGRLEDFLFVLFPKIPRFNFGLFPIFSSSLEKSPYRNKNVQKLVLNTGMINWY